MHIVCTCMYAYIYFPVLHAINERFAADLAVAVLVVVVSLAATFDAD